MCISRFGSRTARGKDPLLSRRWFVQSFLNKSVQRHVIAGVDVDAVVGNAEVQMVAGGNAGGAGGADRQLRQCTLNAVDAAFCSDEIKAKLYKKLEADKI